MILLLPDRLSRPWLSFGLPCSGRSVSGSQTSNRTLSPSVHPWSALRARLPNPAGWSRGGAVGMLVAFQPAAAAVVGLPTPADGASPVAHYSAHAPPKSTAPDSQCSVCHAICRSWGKESVLVGASFYEIFALPTSKALSSRNRTSQAPSPGLWSEMVHLKPISVSSCTWCNGRLPHLWSYRTRRTQVPSWGFAAYLKGY